MKLAVVVRRNAFLIRLFEKPKGDCQFTLTGVYLEQEAEATCWRSLNAQISRQARYRRVRHLTAA